MTRNRPVFSTLATKFKTLAFALTPFAFLAFTSGANAIQLTFSGTYNALTLDPTTNCCVSYYNPNGSLPFAEPTDGTQVTATVLIDALHVDSSVGDFLKSYRYDTLVFQFGANTFSSATSGTLSIFNDTPPGVLPWQIPFLHSDESPDIWLLNAKLTNGDTLGIFFVEPAGQTPADALQSADFSIPDPSLFSIAFFQYTTASADFMGLDVQSVTAQVVPVPAAGWLFASAVLGLVNVKRLRKNA